MKKIIVSLVLLSFLTLPLAASAVDIPNQPGTINDIPTLIDNILTPVWEIFIGLAVIMIIVAGVLFLTANGNPEKIAQARTALLWGIVGIAVGVLAFSITTIITNVVTG